MCNRYAAALAQICIEDKIYNNSVALQVKAISMLLNYCENPSNQVFISSGLQKYIDAMKSGTLQEQIASDFR